MSQKEKERRKKRRKNRKADLGATMELLLLYGNRRFKKEEPEWK